MSSQRVLFTRILPICGLTAVAIWLAFGASRPSNAGQAPGSPTASTTATKPAVQEERQADRDSVQKAVDGLVEAFRKGDAKVVAGQWTTEGEYTSDDGTTFRGRAALEKAYTEYFTKNPGNTLAVEVDTIRFPSRDNAVVEGHLKLRKVKAGELVVSKCSILYAREDGQWRIAIAREWPGDGLSLRDLEWLIGTWEAKRDGAVVTTKYEWTANKSFIRCQFTIAEDGQTQTGMQMIGRMPSTGALHMWTFEDSGGIGDADIDRDGKKWVHTARGATADGRVLTATNILTPVDADTFLWHAVERTLDEEALPDQPPIKVTRVKGK